MTTSQKIQPRGISSQGSVTASAARFLGGITLLAFSAGCPSPDAEGKYELFNDETEEARDRPEPKLDLPPVGVFPDVAGVYLVAIETSIAPGLPLQFVTTVTGEIDSVTGDGMVNLSFQPLSLDQGSMTDPREEVGDPIVIDAAVTGGSFTVPFGETGVTGAANPITGSDIEANLTLEGSVRSENAWCGFVEGDVTSPIQAPLDGSTFAALRLADASERPLTFPVKCDDITDDGGDGGGTEDGGMTEGGDTEGASTGM